MKIKLQTLRNQSSLKNKWRWIQSNETQSHFGSSVYVASSPHYDIQIRLCLLKRWFIVVVSESPKYLLNLTSLFLTLNQLFFVPKPNSAFIIPTLCGVDFSLAIVNPVLTCRSSLTTP